MPKTYVELGIEEFGGLADFYSKNVAAVFASVSDPELQKQLKDADAAAAQAMTRPKGYADRRTQERQRQICVWAGVIRADGQADRAGGSARRRDRGRGPRRSRPQHGGAESGVRQLRAEGLAGAMRRQRWRRTSPKADRVEEARNQLKMLKEFIVQNNVVSIPSNDEALVAEAPPYNRSNAAFINTAGSLR